MWGKHARYPPVKEWSENTNTQNAERQDVEDVGQEHLPFTVKPILTLLITDGPQSRNCWESTYNVMERHNEIWDLFYLYGILKGCLKQKKNIKLIFTEWTSPFLKIPFKCWYAPAETCNLDRGRILWYCWLVICLISIYLENSRSVWNPQSLPQIVWVLFTF